MIWSNIEVCVNSTKCKKVLWPKPFMAIASPKVAMAMAIPVAPPLVRRAFNRLFCRVDIIENYWKYEQEKTNDRIYQMIGFERNQTTLKFIGRFNQTQPGASSTNGIPLQHWLCCEFVFSLKLIISAMKHYDTQICSFVD